jgi:hypothetical protein
VKHLWDFTKVRYRELYKNTVRALALFACRTCNPEPD